MAFSLRCTAFLLPCLLVACAQQPVRHTPPPAALVPAPLPVAPLAGAGAVSSPNAAPQLDPARREAFVAQAAAASGMAPDEVRRWLGQARYQQTIINAMTRPAEGTKTWAQYRPIFMTQARIEQGRAFYAENRSALDAAARANGVPAEIIVAIIGVETSYGKITGTYRVLDALYTLGFFYPRREEDFRSELVNVFTLARKEGLDLATLKGSYAGAMGWGQFMPSSYLQYGRDGDGDGRRDLLGSRHDAFWSIAHYFAGYGWKNGQPAFWPAQADPGAAPFKPDDYIARMSLAELAAKGYRPATPGAPDLPVTLLTLEGANGTEYWIGYPNFYVITRYNRSPMYAMAVHQLAQEIAASPVAAIPAAAIPAVAGPAVAAPGTTP
jgi:membrane-bound lytic murein transglycosylase B